MHINQLLISRLIAGAMLYFAVITRADADQIYFFEIDAAVGTSEEVKHAPPPKSGIAGDELEVKYDFTEDTSPELGLAGDARATASFHWKGKEVGDVPALGLSAKANMEQGWNVIGTFATAHGTFGDAVPLDPEEIEDVEYAGMVFHIHGDLGFGSVLFSIDGGYGFTSVSLVDTFSSYDQYIQYPVKILVDEDGTIFTKGQHYFRYVVDATVTAGTDSHGASGNASFADTFEVLGFNFQDAQGNPIDVSLVGAWGHSYIANPNVVPEPGTLALAGLGAVGLAVGAYRRRRRISG